MNLRRELGDPDEKQKVALQKRFQRLASLGEENMTYQSSKHMKLIKTKNQGKSRKNVIRKKFARVSMQIPPFEQAQAGYEKALTEGRINHNGGFTYIPGEDKVYNANNPQDAQELLKKFGNGKDPIHMIGLTDIHSKHLEPEAKAYYNYLANEGNVPIIGGFQEPEFPTTDITFIQSLPDNQANELAKAHHQRSRGKINPDGTFQVVDTI